MFAMFVPEQVQTLMAMRANKVCVHPRPFFFILPVFFSPLNIHHVITELIVYLAIDDLS